MRLFANIVVIMNSLPNKPFYKVISLFIKTMILFFSFWYIWKKITEANNTINISELIQHFNNSYFILAFLLMFINWGLESIKWKILVDPLESISFGRSIKSILCGITISIFSPNRIGEFAGRIFYLEKANKIQATLASVLGSIFQLSMTILGGVLGFLILENKYHDFFQTKAFISNRNIIFLTIILTVFIALCIFVYLKRNTLFFNYKKYLHVFKSYTSSTMLVIAGLSFTRYVMFSIQYYLVLKLFGITAGTTILFSLITLTFLMTSAIPTFALTEIAVRGAAATYFFSTISTNSTGIIAASLLLWIINLVIPALLGSIFIWKLKFFK